MKTINTLMLSLAFTFTACAQSPSQDSHLVPLAEVWGFLKYYHPNVASGNLDWDSVLVTTLSSLGPNPSVPEIQAIIAEWIVAAGPLGLTMSSVEAKTDTLLRNLDLSILDDSLWLNKDLRQRLTNIRDHRLQLDPYYAFHVKFGGPPNFENEKPYAKMVFPDRPYRLLALFRYWNAIQYFFPYKYLIEKDWKEVLREFIPLFEGAKDAYSYHEAGRLLTAQIMDSHSFFRSKVWQKSHYQYHLPFLLKNIEGKAVVSEVLPDSSMPRLSFKRGDFLLDINGISIDSLKNKFRPYCLASNPPTTERNVLNYLAYGTDSVVRLTVDQNGKRVNLEVRTFPTAVYTDIFRNTYESEDIPHWKILDSNIGYVDMGRLEKGESKKMMKDLKNTQAIIFDVRNYPKGTLYEVCRWLLPEITPFVKFTYPDPLYPGTLNWYPSIYTVGKKRNKDVYDGKVIILQDESTQSHAEFTVMALQQAPDATIIGSQTAGADGNVTSITLPGGIRATFTGLGVYYPDGSETQRIGIVPDIEVSPTLQGMREGRDEVLEKAIEYIQKFE